MAARLGTPKVVVDVGVKAGPATTKVIAAMTAVPAVSYPLRELHAQAREWDRNGRSARLLASKAQRVRAAECADSAGSLERAFLAASARRAARRTTLLVGGILVTVVAALAGSLLFAVRSRVEENNAVQAAAYQRVVDARAEAAKDPYLGLRMARNMGDNESAMHADLLERVLATPCRMTPSTSPTSPRPGSLRHRSATTWWSKTAAVAVGHGRRAHAPPHRVTPW